ncbi:MAG: RNA-guided pseudouridylation complex pseudouridine synthase subunit Cbf5 [Nanoarchaeota archaeon]|nr:RNA-guided pseudouridylation complex pseudouridine synthase subunit Cbf5 [Nanoarchaeota archaeon]
MGNLPFEDIEQDIIVKREAETSDKYGKPPESRTVEELLDYGIINIDKPAGPTSHQVSAYVQKILGIKKAGHSGTLDPQVTGCLPIALGKSTKIAQALLTSGKEYVALMHIHKNIPEYEIYALMEKFTGKLNQLPPIKSAVKRQWRERTVYYNELVAIDGQDVLFKVGCQAGTYIRKLIHDMGQNLKSGAHMAQLRRTKVGPFDESTLFTLQDLTDAYHYYKEEGNDRFIRKIIQPIENAISHLPKIWVMDTTVSTLCHGASLHVPGISKYSSKFEPDQIVAVMTLKNELIAFGRAKMSSIQIEKKQRGLAMVTDKVLMSRDLYPSIIKK